MQIIGGVVAWILAFLFLIFIHELGHFTAAKKLGVKVLEFGMGIPPKMLRLRRDKGGTEYTLNWIPLGGFVRLKGEDPTEEEDFRADDSFVRATLRRKLIILLAGIFVNLIFAFVALTTIFSVGLEPDSLLVTPSNYRDIHLETFMAPSYRFLDQEGFLSGEPWQVFVSWVLSGGLADQAGLLSGDRIVSLNGVSIDSLSLYGTLADNFGQDVRIEIERDDTTIQTETTCPSQRCTLGIKINSPDSTIEILPIKYSFVDAMHMAGREMRFHTSITFSTLWDLFGGLFRFDKEQISQTASKFSGPVAIVGVLTQILNISGFAMFVYIVAIISLALGIFNLLPIPALDGGRVVSSLIMHIFRIKPQKHYKIEWYINGVVFLLLMLLGIVLIIRDATLLQDLF